MRKTLRPLSLAIAAGLFSVSAYGQSQSDVTDPAANSLPNPTPIVIKEWVTLPDDREWGSTAGVNTPPMAMSGPMTVRRLPPSPAACDDNPASNFSRSTASQAKFLPQFRRRAVRAAPWQSMS